MSAEMESVGRLRRRVARLGRVLDQTLQSACPTAPSLISDGTIVVTGAGLAAGTARFLVGYLRNVLSLSAHYTPPSTFATPSTCPVGKALVVFSEGLSANARMVLSQAERFEHVTLITAVAPNSEGADAEVFAAAFVDAGGQLVLHGPDREEGMLVRVLGSSVAVMQGVRWASSLASSEHQMIPSTLPQLVEAAIERAEGTIALCPPEALLGSVAFVTAGGYGDDCRGLAWKWMEGLWADEPPMWDVLQAAHGPLQAFWERDMTLLALCRDDDPAEPLFDRLALVLDTTRHRLIRLRASAPGPLAFFEHSAALDRLMVAALEASPRDLSHWPAKGGDGPVYGLAEPID